MPLLQCFSNCGTVEPCVPPKGTRDPLTNARHVYCNTLFVIFYYLIHSIILVLSLKIIRFILVDVVVLFSLCMKGFTQKTSLGSSALLQQLCVTWRSST